MNTTTGSTAGVSGARKRRSSSIMSASEGVSPDVVLRLAQSCTSRGATSFRSHAGEPAPHICRQRRWSYVHQRAPQLRCPGLEVVFPGQAARSVSRRGASPEREGTPEVALTEGTDRICAFSDGVFAIACTLLILEVRLPPGVEGSLWSALVALWPSYLAFAFSFFVILVTWTTHHDLMRLVRAPDPPARLAHRGTLLYVTFLPFPTAVL